MTQQSMTRDQMVYSLRVLYGDILRLDSKRAVYRSDETIELTCATHGRCEAPVYNSVFTYDPAISNPCPACAKEKRVVCNANGRKTSPARVLKYLEDWDLEYMDNRPFILGRQRKFKCKHHGIFEQEPNWVIDRIKRRTKPNVNVACPICAIIHNCLDAIKQEAWMVRIEKAIGKKNMKEFKELNPNYEFFYNPTMIVNRQCKYHGPYQVKLAQLVRGHECDQCTNSTGLSGWFAANYKWRNKFQ